MEHLHDKMMTHFMNADLETDMNLKQAIVARPSGSDLTVLVLDDDGSGCG